MKVKPFAVNCMTLFRKKVGNHSSTWLIAPYALNKHRGQCIKRLYGGDLVF